MKCLILAAGYATRLYPLTENYPKPLLAVGGKAILDWLVEDVDTAGTVDEYVLVTNHKFAPRFEAWASARPQRITVVDDGTTTNETRLGAVRDLQFAIDQLALDDDLLVLAGDNLLDFSLTRFLDFARQKGTSCTLRYREPDRGRLTRSGVAVIDSCGRLLSLDEKPAHPRSEWCTPPFYYYTRADAARIRDAIADGCNTDAPGSLVSWLCTHSVVNTLEMPGRRYDIGDPESYQRVCEEYRGIVGETHKIKYPKRQ